MNNSRRTVDASTCIGGSACTVCEHITFVKNQYGFDSPMADEPANLLGAFRRVFMTRIGKTNQASSASFLVNRLFFLLR